MTNSALTDGKNIYSLSQQPLTTSGFIIMIDADDCIELKCSVEDGLKYVISLGTLVNPSEILPDNLLNTLKNHE